MTFLAQGPEGREGEEGSSPEQDPQEATSSARLFCHFFKSIRRFRGLTRSMKRIPSRWSISCWRALERRPDDLHGHRLPVGFNPPP